MPLEKDKAPRIFPDGPLNGILVVALEQAVAAPFLSSRLADAGARVIKVERPEGGDFARHYDSAVHGESAYFVWLNRGKQSVSLDLKKTDDCALLEAIIAKADVFIQNLAPGATKRLGLDSSDLRDRYPRLITCDISGYGADGPMRDAKAYDLLVQCESGLASLTGSADQPGRVGVSVCDIATGMTAHAGILEALVDRHNTGRGRGISVAMFDTLADWMAVPLMHFDYAERTTPRVGLSHTTIYPYGAFRCEDGSQIVFSVQHQGEWLRFCEFVMDDSSLANNPRFAHNDDRLKNRQELDLIINAVFGRNSRADMLELLANADLAFSSVNEISDLTKHPQLDRVEVMTGSGPASYPAPPIRRSGETLCLAPVPEFGEDTDAIREEFK